MRLLISKRGLLQYVSIYFLLAFTGSIGFRINNNICIGLAFLLFGYIFFTRKFVIPQHITVFFVVLSISLLIEILITNGGVNISSIASIVSRFAIIVAAIYSDEDRFIDRFVKMSAILALIALLGFMVVQVSPALFRNVFSSITEKVSTPYGVQYARYYGGYIFAFTESAARNIGIYHEPGLYAIVLNVTLYFLLYRRQYIFLSEKSYKMVFIIILASIISCMSTMGYIICVGLIVCRYLLQRESIKPSMRIAVVGVLAILAIYNSIAGMDSFIYKAVFSKITNSAGEFDLFASTGKSRIVSLLADIDVFLTHPFGIGYADYNSTWSTLLIDDTISDVASCVGITQILAILGIGITGVILFFYVTLSHKNLKKNENMAFWFMFICTVFSQPQIWYPPLICILFVDWRRNQIVVTE